MQLKKLEMLGFKSFTDKTVINFQPGVTAVVGPNGCGKSNVSDAIRWVLGEQSAKHLRGDNMEDVIFSGSENRKPTGMAEVTLALTDVAGLPSEFAHYSEIEITRRLYRSGDSEYLVNKIPCRLKDIRDLMMDAGVGAKAHVIIEQGRVDQILSSKPENRRFLFEEAAGVMKYKARRQEALSKLESTQQNQLRVNDILTEVKRQLNSLDRQAKKAERYQKLRAELKDIEFRLAAVDYATLGGEWTASSGEFTEAEGRITALHAQLGTIEASIEEVRAESLSAERELQGLQQAIHETENALGRAEHRVEMSRSQIASLAEQRLRDQKDIEYLRAEAARTAEQRVTAEAEAGNLAAAIHENNTVLLEKTVAFENLSRELKGQEQALETARAGVFDAMNRSTAEKAKISNLQTRLHQIDELDAKAAAEGAALAATLAELTAKAVRKEEDIASLADRRQHLEEERRAAAARIEESLARKKALDGELAAARHRLSSQASRLRSLLELEQSLEGYQKGVQTVMSAKKQAASEDRLGTIHGLVADLIETEPRYESAIEAVLGDRLQHVVVGSHQDSLKAIEFLKDNSGGRSTFIPESPREIKTEPFVKNGHTGVVGSAMSIISCKDDYRNVAQYLLGDVVVVDTMDTALHLWQNNGFHKTLVTLAGEIVDPWGAVTGGAADAGGAGMLRKRREIKDLEHEVAELTAAVMDIEQRIQSLEASLEADKAGEAELARQFHAAELELLHHRKDGAALHDEIGRASARKTVLEQETAQRTAGRTALAAELDRAAAALRSLEDGHSTAQAAIEELQARLAAEKEHREAALAEITELRMAITALQEKQSAAVRSLDSLGNAEADLAARMAKHEAEIGSIGVKIRDLESAITSAEEEIRGYIATLEGRREVLIAKQEAHTEKSQALQSSEEEARQIRHDIEAAQKQLSAVEVRRTELRMKIEHLKDNIWTSYHTELEAVVKDLGEFELNVEEAKQKGGDLRQKIDQMGPINVDALQEFNELKERYDLLSTQINDITESIANLKATIAKLDGETTELFTQAYTAIHEKFKEVFSILFDGGKAELVLLDPANILESGIEIIAQPKGKKFQAITLLSGGERALTAIALLFAAFLVKPSPFCLMDEVDAPLDEANVGRFTRLIREMSNRSQFIMITHNKRTMEMADALYGITMEEPGCSKVVSVKLREAVPV